MGAKREKGARERHATQSISFPSTEPLQLREAAEEYDHFKKEKEKKRNNSNNSQSLVC